MRNHVLGGDFLDLKELVALGGLFHDIGKPVQRAGFYSGTHSKQGAKFLRDLARNTGKAEYDLLALFSEFHHYDQMIDEKQIRRKIREASPERFGLNEEEVFKALQIVYEADNLASGEREKEGTGSLMSLRPLYSIFDPERAYPLQVLDLKEKLPFPKNIASIRAEEYRNLVKNLWKELLSVGLRLDMLLPIFEKYLTFVSSVTRKGNVISLYDHVRMTSALALAMLNAGCTVEDIKSQRCRKEKMFLLIEGDFSGIQDFIYGVSGKGTLKYLRARSAYLELIGWDIVLEVIKRLNLTRANVIFNAGGHFLIIGHNTHQAVKTLKEIREDVVNWIYREFDGRLYIALDWEPLSGEELGRTENENLFQNVLERLKKKLLKKKVRRFEEIPDLFKVSRSERLVECSVCGKELPENELEDYKLDPGVKVCRTCNELSALGGMLPKVRGFILDKKAREGEGIIRGPFRYFIPYPEGSSVKGEFLLLKNTLTPPANMPPDTQFVPYLVADYFKPEKGTRESVMSFDDLANASLGVKRIGVIKGDVDRLGDFFRTMDSPSKLATASRFMDYFFKAYLNELIKDNLDYPRGEIPSLAEWSSEPEVVVVYAGGDDFFIVGAWHRVFDLAFRIREAFNSYTGGKRTISAGLGYFDEKMPIYRIAEVVSERLDLAKDEGRNRVTVIERTKPSDSGHPVSYEWNSYKELWNRYARKIYAGNGNLTKSYASKKDLLMKILSLRELYVRNPRSIKWTYLLAYLLGRHELSEDFPNLVRIDAKAFKEGKPQEIYWVDGVLKIVLMAVRG